MRIAAHDITLLSGTHATRTPTTLTLWRDISKLNIGPDMALFVPIGKACWEKKSAFEKHF